MNKRTRREPFKALCVSVLAACIATGSLQAQQTGKYPEETLQHRIERITKQCGTGITYDGSLPLQVQVSPLTLGGGEDAGVLLAHSLKGTGMTYRKVGNAYVILEEAEPQQRASKAQQGSISGTVVDKEGYPIPGATVVVAGTSNGVATDMKGNYTLRNVPARSVTVEVSCLSYRKTRISNVMVKAGKTVPLDVILQEEDKQLQEVVVTATYNQASANGLYAKQKAMTAMSDGVSADMMKRTADNNLGQVMRRLPGVTVNDGKSVTIRGVTDRYNNVSLNGANMPSTDPNKKTFSLDIIPTGLIDNVVVTKTFTPDMSAEFAGGAVDVSTLSIPAQSFFSASVGTGWNSNSTGKDFWSGKRYKSDYLLGNANERYWYGRDWILSDYNSYVKGANQPDYATWIDKEKAYAMNAAVPANWGWHKFKAAPMYNFSITGGAPLAVGEHKLGVAGGVTYRHEENIENYEGLDWGIEDTIRPSTNYNFISSVGAMANASWEFRGNKIMFKNMYTNRFEQNNRQRVMKDVKTGYWETLVTSPNRTNVFQTRLEGEHKLWDERLLLGWYADYNRMNRDLPDERNLQGMIEGTVQNYPVDPQGRQYVGWMMGADQGMGSHIYTSALDEWKKNIGLNLTMPFEVLGNPQKVKVGYDGSWRKADFHQLTLNVFGPGTGAVKGTPADEYLRKELFANGSWFYGPYGLSFPDEDRYNGKLDIRAGFLMGEFTFLKRLHVMGGVRMEKAKQRMTAKFKGWAGDGKQTGDSTIVRDKTDFFPAASLTYNITDNLNLRGSFSKTIARTDFRDFYPGEYYDLTENIRKMGNDELVNTYSTNWDARIEWYPNGGEVVSVSAFHKKFKNPVETVMHEWAGNYTLEPMNLKESVGKGFELNVRKSLEFIAPGSFLKECG